MAVTLHPGTYDSGAPMSEPESTTTKTLDEMLAELTEEAVRNLSRGADDETSARVKADLPKIAAILALEWITGDRRSETISQQTQSWLTFLYERLYTDEEPSAADIFARFDLPLSRAQYLARMLPAQFSQERAEQGEKLDRQRAQSASDEARGELGRAFEPHVQDITDANARQKPFDIAVSRAAYDELLAIIDLQETGAGAELLRPPQRTASTPARIYFTIRGYTLLRVLDALNGDSR